MASPLVVPVIDVQHDNFTELWPAMVLALKSSSFIALDTVKSRYCALIPMSKCLLIKTRMHNVVMGLCRSRS